LFIFLLLTWGEGILSKVVFCWTAWGRESPLVFKGDGGRGLGLPKYEKMLGKEALFF
jgi:hypothetical protein